MKQSRTTLPVVALALLLVGALLVWLASDVAATRRSGADTNRVDSGEAARADVELAASEAPHDEAATAARRALAGEALIERPVAATPTADDGPCRVRIVAEGVSWLRDTFSGRMTWTPEGGAPEVLFVDHNCVELPRAPRSHEEFSELWIASLVARPLALTPLAPTVFQRASDPKFALEVEILVGATVDWAPSVPRDARTPVEVVIGGRYAPPFETSPTINAGAGLSTRATGVVLPLQLPRVAEATSLWVSAPGRSWRAFELAPTTELIEVALARPASLRVRHDGVIGTEVVASLRYIGSKVRAPIVDADDVELSDLAATGYLVWIEHNGRKSSYAAVVDLDEGESGFVDLRAAAALDGLGGVRVVVRAGPEVFAATQVPISVGIRRGAASDALTSDRMLGSMQRVATESGELVFERLALEPERHTLTLAPFGACAEVVVRAGEVVTHELVVDGLGRVRFELPAGLAGGQLSWAISGFATGSSERTRFSATKVARDGESYPLVCGTYTVGATYYVGEEATPLVSEPFVVTVNTTTVVPLGPRAVANVQVAAIEVRSGAPIAFDSDFWGRMRVVDSASNVELRGTTNYHGQEGAYSSVTWTHNRYEGRVRFELPESPFWTFEPLTAIELIDGATITLRATAK